MKVTFIEDKITKVRRKQTEVVMVSQFIPGDRLTVKHDLYSAYDVTALLKRFPIRRGDDIEYEVILRKTEQLARIFNFQLFRFRLLRQTQSLRPTRTAEW